MQNLVMLFALFVFDRKGKFGPNCQYCQFQVKLDTQTNSNMQNSMAMLTFCIRPEMPFLGKFGPNFQYCQFEVKLDIQTNLNIQNSITVFTFLFFGGKFGLRNKNYQFNLKFPTKINSNMQNSIVMFSFSTFEWKYTFGENLVQKLKIVSLS